MFQFSKHHGGFWLRVFGWGFSIKDTTKVRLLFSERELGHGLQIGKYRVRGLKPIEWLVKKDK